MQENKENILKVVYPMIFSEKFYFECGNGWFDLISEICEFVSKRTDKLRAAQVKEKFGSLRFYYDIDGEINEDTLREINAFISSVETKSHNTCEDCGTALTRETKYPQSKLGYWIRNVCNTCGDAAEEEAGKKIAAKAYKIHARQE